MNIDDLYRMLRSGHSQLQGIVDTTPDPMVVLDADLSVLNANRAFFETFKVERFDTIGQHIYELGNGQWNIPQLRLLLEDVIPKTSVVVDYRVDHDFPAIGRRSMLLTARTLYHPDNLSRTMLLSFVDATNRLRREAQTEILFGEMHHRMKNLFTTTQALARQSITEGRTAEQFRDDFLARFSNLVRSSEMAFGTDVVGLRQLVECTLAPYADAESLVIKAVEDFDPGPNTLLSLSMVLHELATNAVKYGSLSVPGGKVEVDWNLDVARGGLHLRWVEHGGPPPSPPKRRGYGSKLITSIISFTLEGTQEQSFGSEGFSIDLFIPLAALDVPVTADPGKSESDHANDGAGG